MVRSGLEMGVNIGTRGEEPAQGLARDESCVEAPIDIALK